MHQNMKKINKKLIAGKIYPRSLKWLRLLNLNAEFLEWARNNEPKTVFENTDRMKWNYSENVVSMYTYINNVLLKNVAIDYIEFGVFEFEGRTLQIWSKINEKTGSRFFGFDSFEGLPEDWSFAIGPGIKKGTFSLQGTIPDLRDNRIKLIKGLFQETLRDFKENYQKMNPLVVHMDADLYSSTLFCLTVLDDIIEDSVVIFDEFSNLPHEYSAFRNYLAAYRREYEVIARCGYFQQIAVRIGKSF